MARVVTRRRVVTREEERACVRACDASASGVRSPVRLTSVASRVHGGRAVPLRLTSSRSLFLYLSSSVPSSLLRPLLLSPLLASAIGTVRLVRRDTFSLADRPSLCSRVRHREKDCQECLTNFFPSRAVLAVSSYGTTRTRSPSPSRRDPESGGRTRETDRKRKRERHGATSGTGQA